ncbi:hypothetical protein HZ326_30218, partial [Fusarium oxysporum f. sp. albedinis]
MEKRSEAAGALGPLQTPNKRLPPPLPS